MNGTRHDAAIAMLYIAAVTLGCWLAHTIGLALECWWIRRKVERGPHCGLCLREGTFWPQVHESPGTYCPPCALVIAEVRALSLRRKA